MVLSMKETVKKKQKLNPEEVIYSLKIKNLYILDNGRMISLKVMEYFIIRMDLKPMKVPFRITKDMGKEWNLIKMDF